MPSPAALSAARPIPGHDSDRRCGHWRDAREHLLAPPGIYGRRRDQLTDWWGHSTWVCTAIIMFVWVIALA